MAVEVAAALPGNPRSAGRLVPRSLAFGLAASMGLLLFYLGTVALLQDWEHAASQLREDAPFIAALVTGFGVQVGLLTYARALAVQARKAGVAASTGVSGVAMLACCAHHLTDLLPVVGLSAAAAFLGAYKIALLWLSVAVNVAGVIYMVRQVWEVSRLRYAT